MVEHKTIIDEKGNIVDRCVSFVNGTPIYFQMKPNYTALDYCSENFVKPKLVNNKWIEDATEEEIKQWEKDNMCKYTA